MIALSYTSGPPIGPWKEAFPEERQELAFGSSQATLPSTLPSTLPGLRYGPSLPPAPGKSPLPRPDFLELGRPDTGLAAHLDHPVRAPAPALDETHAVEHVRDDGATMRGDVWRRESTADVIPVG